MSFIKMSNGSYYNLDAIEKEFKYCTDKCEYWGGCGIRTDSINSAIFDMMQVKKFANKEDGKQLYHMIITIKSYTAKDNNRQMTENSCCRLIGYEVSQILYNLGYQCAFFKHKSNENIHLHFVINSVNFLNGNKLTGESTIINFIAKYLKREYTFLQWYAPFGK